MLNNELYEKYLIKIKDYLIKEDLEGLDNFFLNMPSNVSIIIPIDILDSVTEYVVSKNKNNKIRAIQLIDDFKDNK